MRSLRFHNVLGNSFDPERNPGQVQASFDRGVLEVRIPKPEQKKPRKVTISAGGGAPKTIEGSETQASNGAEAPATQEPSARPLSR